MTVLTLQVKAFDSQQLGQLADALRFFLEDLNVKVDVTGTTTIGSWVQVALTGEDESVAARFISRQFGLCTEGVANVKKFSKLTGYITEPEKNALALQVDIGVIEQKPISATIPLTHLQAQFVDGRKVALKKIIELFGFCEGLPLSLKVSKVNETENCIELELTAKQIEKYKLWQEAFLDKILVLGVAYHEINGVLKYTQLNRDIIQVEYLGIFQHALTCKLGTDATGLIPKLGSALKSVKLGVFNPRKISDFLES
ncbi:MAG: DUF2110 family protein [Candidatus Bathyarchaeia archaeon]